MAEYDNQTSTFAGDNYSTSIDNQRRALLAAVAEGGAEGAQAFKTAQANNADRRQGALNAAAARGAAIHAPESLNAELRDTFDSMSNVGLGDSALSSEREQARIAASNSAYLDQMKTVAPLREQYYNAELAKIAAQQNAAAGSGTGSGTGTPVDPFNPYEIDTTNTRNPRDVPELGDYLNGNPYLAGSETYITVLNQGGTREQATAAAFAAASEFVGVDGLTAQNVQDIMTEIQYQAAGITSTNAPPLSGPIGPPGYYTSSFRLDNPFNKLELDIGTPTGGAFRRQILERMAANKPGITSDGRRSGPI